MDTLARAIALLELAETTAWERAFITGCQRRKAAALPLTDKQIKVLERILLKREAT